MVMIEGRIREVKEIDLSKTLKVKYIHIALELDVERVEPAEMQSSLRADAVFRMERRGTEPLHAGMRVQLEVDPPSWASQWIGILKLRVLK